MKLYKPILVSTKPLNQLNEAQRFIGGSDFEDDIDNELDKIQKGQEYDGISSNRMQLNALEDFLKERVHGMTFSVTSRLDEPSENMSAGKTIDANINVENASANADDYYYEIKDENQEIKNGYVVLPDYAPENLFKIILDTMKQRAGAPEDAALRVVKIIKSGDTANESKKEPKSKKLNESVNGGCLIIKAYSEDETIDFQYVKSFNAAKQMMQYEIEKIGGNIILQNDTDIATETEDGYVVGMTVLPVDNEKRYILIKFEEETGKFTIGSYDIGNVAELTMEHDWQDEGNGEGECFQQQAVIPGKFMYEIIMNE